MPMIVPNASLKLGDLLYEIDDEQGHAQSIWPDGKALTAVFSFGEDDVARALSLGYSGAAAMHREHDLAHHLVARALGWPWSPLLRLLAEGHTDTPVGLGQTEERLAFLVQRASNVGIAGLVGG